ncbi:type II toxin-antitoxin system HipA family toxin [Roseateles flavus]|uniref:Type II toxin-antitoxin system HipA family toxin n=1 Tax=Roseateles flavus TaxID=3149041 RepID=A0ABV0GIR7_9BURK
MARKRPRALQLWMNGTRVGTWTLPSHAPDILQYDPQWTQSPAGRPLSLSLPFTPGNQPLRGDAVRAYFENLLPDSKDIRERMARRFGVSASSAYELLAEVGRDCVGALEILPEGAVPTGTGPLQARPLDEAEVAQVLRSATMPQSLGRADDVDFRLSLAGAQEKTALLQQEGRWFMPQGSTPTTHIFKLPLGLIGGLKIDMRHSVENEWLCSMILKAFGVPVADCWPAQFEDVKVLVVERFDRAWLSNLGQQRRLLRLPQEDLCQATATPPSIKYEADGGPGMDRLMTVLGGSVTREEDRRIFFKAQLLFWLLRAPDGHAKNFSLRLLAGGRYQLTPLYDVLSAYPVLGTGRSQLSPFKVKMAMAVRSKNPHWEMRGILRRHWLALGARYGITTEDGRPAAELIDEMIEAVPQVVDTVQAELPPGFPDEVASRILKGLLDAAQRLKNPAPSNPGGPG